ncbi:MAG: ribosome-recycling factor [Candidatus Paceibacterota bacterium]|jgi:ribosome recycling factor
MENIKQELQGHLDIIRQMLKDEVAAVRGSRPTPALVEDIMVEYYGQKMPIKQMGSIGVVPPREIQVSVWDQSAASLVAKAISDKLNVQAAPDGSIIHVNLPSLTQDRKDELIKMVRAKIEDARIKSRTMRDEIKKKIADKEKAAELTEDDKFELGEFMQKAVDAFNKDLDAVLEKKIAEINE